MKNATFASASAWLLAALVLAACNLSPITPEPVVVPTPSNVPPLLASPDAFQFTAIPVATNPNCATTPPDWIQYVVEPGDSLTLLAVQTDSTVADLMTGNCLTNADQIEVGAILYLPREPVITP